MKKILILSLFTTIIFSTISCSSNTITNEYKDGTFEAAGSIDSNTGFQDRVKIVISDGKIIEVDYNGFTSDGLDRKTISNPESGELFTYNMVSAGAQSNWYEQAELLEKYLIDNQSVENIRIIDGEKTDTVAGVSIKTAPFVDLTNQALNQAK